MSQEAQEEVLATIQIFMRFWEQPGAESANNFLAYVADDFRGFGTGEGEYYPDWNALQAHAIRERQDNTSSSIKFAAPWMTVRLLRESVALAEGEFRVDVQSEAGSHVVCFRTTLLFEHRQDRWMLVHFHMSVPNKTQTEGDSLLELFKSRNRNLEQQVQRRTAELERSLSELKTMQARLVHQEKMASLGALTAGIAHEIKNPLNFVNNFAALSRDLAKDLVHELETVSSSSEVASILADLTTNTELIEQHGQRADRIVRSMLEHARGGSTDRRAVDLNALVSEHVDLAWHGRPSSLAGFEVAITKRLDPTVGQLEVVPQEIGRVLLNLLGNAFDALHERAEQRDTNYRPEVTVITQKVDDCVEIRVCDNGPGIPSAIRTKIFEPFFTTKSTGLGTGLGLSMAYDIIAQGHGGSLTVESEEGSGTSFVIRLRASTVSPPI